MESPDRDGSFVLLDDERHDDFRSTLGNHLNVDSFHGIEQAGREPSTGGQRHHLVAGGTIGEAINHLVSGFPELGKRLAEATLPGNAFVNIYLNDDDARFAQGLETPVKPGDEISVVSAIVGG